jgi:hypothetical protein
MKLLPFALQERVLPNSNPMRQQHVGKNVLSLCMRIQYFNLSSFARAANVTRNFQNGHPKTVPFVKDAVRGTS